MSKQTKRTIMSQTQAAQLRGCSRQAIGGYIKVGRLASVRQNGRRMVYYDEVMDIGTRTNGRPRTNRP